MHSNMNKKIIDTSNRVIEDLRRKCHWISQEMLPSVSDVDVQRHYPPSAPGELRCSVREKTENYFLKKEIYEREERRV